ncbi:hypothetical protein [Methylocaldum sp.]|uniref:hypothetical protein n=1 Tax=Methylocaldum sp. TaxID=1969727 RepID=UPI002D2E1101|nr:hypothetical protein [Methylocaldum sp.]HYE35531.1 hypothetical protein [Methylocaldum sp.]
MKNDYGKSTGRLAVLNGAVIALVLQAPSVSARTLGLVADNTESSVTVFDADTDTVLGSMTITPGSIGDVLVTPDQTRGFVTNFNSEVFVIDLTASPPRLAGGMNPIPIANNGEDLSISPDGKFLVVSNGRDPQPISVIDIATQTEIHTLSVGSNTNSIDVCSNGSVLATSSDGTVRRLTLSGTGTLTDTGERLSLGDEPNNVFCAPGGTSGLVITTFSSEMTSFTIPGLERVDTRALSAGFGISGLINSAGNRAFARSSYEGFFDVFDYNATTAALGATPLLSVPISNTFGFFGIDQMALHPNKAKLYVSEFFANALNVYDANTGALLTSITDPHIVEPTGVTVAAVTDPCAGPPPAGAIVGTNGPDALRGTPGNDVIFGLDGNDAIDGRGGDDLICGGPGNDTLKGDAGDNLIDGAAGQD